MPPQRLKGYRFNPADLIIVVSALLMCGTSMLNDLGIYDGISASVHALLYYAAPFLLGRAVLRDRRDLLLAARYVVIAASICGVAAVWEWRMSPQIHNFLYGVFPHDWLQHVRWGFYRPILCFPHALGLGIFMVWTAMLGLALHRAKAFRAPLGFPPVLWLMPVFMGLAVSMSLGPWMLFAFGAAVWYLTTRYRMRYLLAVPLVIALGWMVGRYTEVASGSGLIKVAQVINAERAESLAYRVNVETELLEKAKDRKWFGWGGYGRSRIEDSGYAVDGLWINRLGMYGILGLATFYLWWCWPVIWARHVGREVERDPVLSSLLVVVGLVAVNFLFNNFLDPMLVVLSGAAVSNLMRLREEARVRAYQQQLAPAGAYWAPAPPQGAWAR